MRMKRAIACVLAAVLTVIGCISASAMPLSNLSTMTPEATQPDATEQVPGATSAANPAQEQQAEAEWYDESAYRNVAWDVSLDAVAEAEQGKARSSTVTVQEDVWLYGLEMKKLVYQFREEVMTSRTFTAKTNNVDAFSYLFFSLFRRYGVPILAEKRKAVWGDVQATITLQRGSEGLTIRYETLR